MPGGEFLQRVDHVGFGRHQEFGRLLHGGDVLPHFFGAADHVGVFQDGMRAFGVGEDDRAGVVPLGSQQILNTEDLVDHARAGPEDHLAAGDFREVTAQVLIRDEENLFVSRDAVDDFAGIAARHDPVAQRFDGRRRVDVGDGLEIVPFRAKFLLVRGEFVGRATVGQRATGLQVGHQHPLVRAEDLGRFPHEVNAAEDDRAGRHGRGVARELQAVAGEVGDFLQVAVDVEVRQNDRVFLFFESVDLIHEVERVFFDEFGLSKNCERHGRSFRRGGCRSSGQCAGPAA